MLCKYMVFPLLASLILYYLSNVVILPSFNKLTLELACCLLKNQCFVQTGSTTYYETQIYEFIYIFS